MNMLSMPLKAIWKSLETAFKISKIYQTDQQMAWQMPALLIIYEYLLYEVSKLPALELLKTAKQNIYTSFALSTVKANEWLTHSNATLRL